MRKINDLGNEKISKLLMRMSLQTTISVLLYSIYSMEDIYFVSVGINEFAAGAVSVTSPILLLLGAVSTMVGTGAASIISRQLGENNKQMAANVAANAMLIFWIFAIINMFFGLIFIEPILRFLGTTDLLMSYAKQYARIILIGSVTSTGFSAIVRAEGNIKFSMYMWVVPVIVNLILDPLLIIVFGLKIEGAAIATVCAQTIALIMSLYFFFIKRTREYFIKKYHFKLKFHIVKELFLIGFPSLALQLSATTTTIIINNIMKIEGDIILSIYGILSKIQIFLLMPQNGIVQGMQPIVGYNFGQGKKARVDETISLSSKSIIVYGLIIIVISYLYKKQLISLFIKNEKMLTVACEVFDYLIISLPIKSIPTLISSYYQAIGKAKISLEIPLVNMLIIQIPILLGMSIFQGIRGTFISFIVSDILGFIFAIYIYFKKGKIENGK